MGTDKKKNSHHNSTWLGKGPEGNYTTLAYSWGDLSVDHDSKNNNSSHSGHRPHWEMHDKYRSPIPQILHRKSKPPEIISIPCLFQGIELYSHVQTFSIEKSPATIKMLLEIDISRSSHCHLCNSCKKWY